MSAQVSADLTINVFHENTEFPLGNYEMEAGQCHLRLGKIKLREWEQHFRKKGNPKSPNSVITALPLFLETQQVRETWVNENTNALQLTQSKHAKQDAVLSPPLLRIDSILHGHSILPGSKADSIL